MRALNHTVSRSQAEALIWMATTDSGEIYRFSGGYWAPPGTQLHSSGSLAYIPIWWAAIETLRALSRVGLIEYLDRHTWRLTLTGRAVARELYRQLFPQQEPTQGRSAPPARGSVNGGDPTLDRLAPGPAVRPRKE
jgi:hypothetical protein